MSTESHPSRSASKPACCQSKSRLLPAIVATAVLIALAIFFSSRRSEPPPLPEVTQADLERSSEGMRLIATGELFTGYLISFYPDGEMRSRSMLVDGELNGTSEGWYQDGTPETREEFVSGVSHGKRTRWHANGAVASEAEIVDGQLHGTFRRWYENGQLAQVIPMQQGKAHGTSLAYFPSGFLQAKAEMADGQPVSQTFWQDGEQQGDSQP